MKAEPALGDFALADTMVLDERTRLILENRRKAVATRRRGWLVRRMLALADVFGLILAFLGADLIFGGGDAVSGVATQTEFLIFLLTLPGWIVLAKLHGLYDNDEERTDHSTVDDVIGVFHLVTVGAWLSFAGTQLSGLLDVDVAKLVGFWGLSVGLVSVGRAGARAYCRRRITYLQNTVIAGAGDVGHDIARKLLRHPEYGINLVGFVDADPKDRRPGLEFVRVLGPPDQLPFIVRFFDVERVIIAFSNDSPQETVKLIRSLGDLDVQVDIVPRLFEILGPGIGVHTVEGLPLVGVAPLRLSQSSRFLKRSMDILVSALGLVVLAPLFLLTALCVKLDSPGPGFFRQIRMGAKHSTFRVFKFRTMIVDAEERKEEIAHPQHAQARRRRRAHVQGSFRSARHARGSFSAPLLARRAPATPERPQGRDVVGGAATVDPRRGSGRDRLGAEARQPEARDHGAVAGARSERHSVRGDDAARLPLCHELVVRERPPPDASNAPGGRPRPPGVLARCRRQGGSGCVLFVASNGGHLLQLVRLSRQWAPSARHWVTFDKPDARSLLEGESVSYAYHPPNGSIRNLVRNWLLALELVVRLRPRAVVTTGAGVALPFCYLGRLFGARIVYVESFSRVTEPSLTARLVHPVADRFFVQRPGLVYFFSKAEYRGSVV